MVVCSYLLTQDLTFKIILNLKFQTSKNFLKLINNPNTSAISLITLTFVIISSLSWFVIKTLKEGRKALTEINKNRSWISQKTSKNIEFPSDLLIF